MTWLDRSHWHSPSVQGLRGKKVLQGVWLAGDDESVTIAAEADRDRFEWLRRQAYGAGVIGESGDETAIHGYGEQHTISLADASPIESHGLVETDSFKIMR